MKGLKMKKIVQLLHLSNTRGKFGVEIELEGRGLSSCPTVDEWRKERDGSLSQGGVEFVLRSPLDKEGVYKSLDNLYNVLKETTVIQDRQRAGVHVHLNCQQRTLNEIFTMITAYLLLEDILMEWCGEMRKGNHFCFSAENAEALILNLRQAVVSRNINLLNTDQIRYASLNVQSLFRYGSLEFRGMRSTSEPQPIKDWVGILDELTEKAMEFSNPQELIEAASGYGEDRFLDILLPSYKKEMMKMKSFKKGCVLESARRLQVFAYCSSWPEEKSPEYTNPFATPSETNNWG